MGNYRVEPEAPVASGSKQRRSYSPEDIRKKVTHSQVSAPESTDPDPDPNPHPHSTTAVNPKQKSIFEIHSTPKIHQFASNSRTWLQYLMLTTDPHPSSKIKVDNARIEYLKAKDDHIK